MIEAKEFYVSGENKGSLEATPKNNNFVCQSLQFSKENSEPITNKLEPRQINEQLQNRIAAKVRNKQNWMVWSHKTGDARPSNNRPLTTANYRSSFKFQ